MKPSMPTTNGSSKVPKASSHLELVGTQVQRPKSHNVASHTAQLIKVGSQTQSQRSETQGPKVQTGRPRTPNDTSKFHRNPPAESTPKRPTSAHSQGDPNSSANGKSAGLYVYSAAPRTPPVRKMTRHNSSGSNLKDDFSDVESTGADNAVQPNHHHVELRDSMNEWRATSPRVPGDSTGNDGSTALQMQLSSRTADDENNGESITSTSSGPEMLDMSEFTLADDDFLENEGWRNESDDESLPSTPCDPSIIQGFTHPQAVIKESPTTAEVKLKDNDNNVCTPRRSTIVPSGDAQKSTKVMLRRAAARLSNADGPIRDSVEGLGQFSPPISLDNSMADLAGPLDRIESSPTLTESFSVNSDELDLVYDPDLNCYFDPVSKRYYERVLAPTSFGSLAPDN